MIRGRCLCGRVALRITGRPLAMYHCHCGTCRRASGASFTTNLAVASGDFEITAGREALAAFESSPGKRRHFCSGCGSPVYSEGAGMAGFVSVRSGLLLDDPGLRPSFHAHVASKAPWVQVDDGLPAYPAGRPAP